MLQLIVKGVDGKSYTINIEEVSPLVCCLNTQSVLALLIIDIQDLKVSQLKEKVKEKTGIDKDSQRLIYGGKQLEDSNQLKHYPTLRHRSTIFLVLRLLGGTLQAQQITHTLPHSKDPCMITFEQDSADSPVYVMPCGHSISPDALLDYCWSELEQRKSEIHCPLCSTEWPIDVICKYGCPGEAEKSQLEIGLSKNFCLADPNILECPSCTSFCERRDHTRLCVQCSICIKKKGKSYHFCWQCLQEWKNSPSSDKCGNSICGAGEVLKQLRKAPMVKPKYINVECPSIRACINCGTLITLASGCKHMQCKCCQQEFCFVCLRPKLTGSWACGQYNTSCTAAPRQTRIPTRRS